MPMNDIYLNDLGTALGSVVEPNNEDGLGHGGHDYQRMVSKIGIRARVVVSDNEYTSDLANRATSDLLQRTASAPSSIDALVVCTQTPDHLLPGVSSRVHGALGLREDCFTMDINQGCSGFIYGTHTLAALLRGREDSQGVLVNADCYSRLIRRDDVTTRILFGDAASAAMFSTRPGGLRLVYSRCYADGRGYDDFVARNSAARKGEPASDGIHMNGPAILSFALRVVPKAIDDALMATGLPLSRIRMVAFHQANDFVIGKLVNKLGLSAEQAPQNCQDLGNTVSASIPLLLAEHMDRLDDGDYVLAIGFGVGLSWGAALFQRARPL